MNQVLPFFKSQYSLGRSILTLEKPEDVEESGPDSIIDISQKNDLKEAVIADDSSKHWSTAIFNGPGA